MHYLTRLHRSLESSRVAAGFIFGLNCPALAELLVAKTELDFIVVDLQHAPVTAGDLTHLLQAIQAADPQVTPLVRLSSHDVYWIQHALDAGYVGLIAPLVESADQARQIVRAAYFPPKGSRSVAQSVRVSLYEDYLSASNGQMILLPQIESAKGLERVDEIIAVEGVTGLLVGPGDLSLDCGWNGQQLWQFEPFLAAVKRVVSSCRRHGKAAAILTDAAGSLAAAEAGFQIIGTGCDQAFVRLEMATEVNRSARMVSGRPLLRPPTPTGSTAAQTAKRINAYRASLDRFNRWVEANRRPDGSWRQPSSVDGYFSLIPYANYIGRHDWALSAAQTVQRQFVNADGSLKQGQWRDTMVPYVPSWLVWGALESEAFSLSVPLLDYVTLFQSSTHGGLFGSDEARRRGCGPIDFDSTAIAAVALARAGRTEACARAADFLLNLYRAQPALEYRFCTAWSVPEGLLVEGNGVTPESIVRWSEPSQHYRKIGLLATALAHAYGATGRKAYLETALSVYDQAVARAMDLWDNTLSHKMCWVATCLYNITQSPKYREHAWRLADHLVQVQADDGSYHYPEFWPSYPPPQWEMIPNISAQFALWIARTLRITDHIGETR